MACSGGARGLRALPRRDVGIALALGAVGYSAQAGGYFAALDRLDASLLSLLVYTFPTIVTVTAIALGRERASRRTARRPGLASTGLVLVLAGAGDGALDPLGTALGLAAAVVYSVYILASEGVAARVGPLALSTLVCTGAATTLTLGGIAAGDLDPGSVSAAGFGWLAGTRRRLDGRRGRPLLRRAAARGPDGRVDPVDRSSRWSPSRLAFLVFGESLGPVQLAGGALVLLAVLAVRVPAPHPSSDVPKDTAHERLDAQDR